MSSATLGSCIRPSGPRSLEPDWIGGRPGPGAGGPDSYMYSDGVVLGGRLSRLTGWDARPGPGGGMLGKGGGIESGCGGGGTW